MHFGIALIFGDGSGESRFRTSNRPGYLLQTYATDLHDAGISACSQDGFGWVFHRN